MLGPRHSSGAFLVASEEAPLEWRGPSEERSLFSQCRRQCPLRGAEFVAIARKGEDIPVGPEDGGLRAMLGQPFRADTREHDGGHRQAVEQGSIANHREALADRLVHQPAVAKLRLREDRAHRRRRVEAATQAVLRLRVAVCLDGSFKSLIT